MSLRLLCRFLPVLLAISFFSVPGVPQSATGDFSIILFPDTQNEAQFFPQVLQAETQWAVNNRAAMNIQAVLGLGDIVNDGADVTQQQNADSAIRTLDTAGVPYLLAIGNHDYDGGNAGAFPRLMTGFNQWWGPTRYAGKSYYKGNFPSGSNENFYGVLSINGKQYLILVLEYIPRTASINWAASIVKANPDKEVIVVTHSYMFYDNTRVDACDTQDLGGTDNNGDAVWSRFASQYSNVIMVLSGHITTGLAGRRSDLGVNGNLVNQMLSNYQVLPNGGDGWLRILTFHPSSDTISVQTYSPYLNSYKTDSANQFTLPYHDPGSNGTGMGQISGRVRSSTCQSLSGLTVIAGGSSAVTDSNGKYTLSLAAGQNYSVTASGSGWNSATQSAQVNDNLAAGPTDVNFFMIPSSTAPCAPSPANPSVTICGPTSNSPVSSPFRVRASTTDSSTVQFIEIYVDGSKQYHGLGGMVDTTVSVALAGTHQLTVKAYDGTSYIKKTISITVSSVSGTTVSALPGSLDFASRNVGSTSPAQTVQVTNNNTSAAVALSSVAASGDFAQTNNCGSSIAAGVSCTVNVTFTPSATGARTGMLMLTDSASNSPQTVSLSGTGGSSAPATTVTLSPSSLSFASQNGGSTSPAQTVQVTNDNTSAAATLSSVAASGDFAESNNCGSSIAAGASCTVSVTFTPTATGARTGTLMLTDSASNSPQTVSLSGTGAMANSCTAGAVNHTVTICAPTNGETISSPVHIAANTTDATPVQRLEVWVDGVKVYQVFSASLTTDVAIASGANHRLTVQAFDGIYFKTTIFITVQ